MAPAEASSNSNSHGFLWQSMAEGSAQGSFFLHQPLGGHAYMLTRVPRYWRHGGKLGTPYRTHCVWFQVVQRGLPSLVEHCSRVFVSRRTYSEHGHINVSGSCRNLEGVNFFFFFSSKLSTEFSWIVQSVLATFTLVTFTVHLIFKENLGSPGHENSLSVASGCCGFNGCSHSSVT